MLESILLIICINHFKSYIEYYYSRLTINPNNFLFFYDITKTFKN